MKPASIRAVSVRASASGSPSGLSTRARLIRAAEKLFAEHGVGPTSTRAILREAEQRNESALQYHFGGREGLVEALYVERGSQVNEEREAMFREIALGALEDAHETDIGIRRLCEVALMPPVRLARRHPEFLLFLKVIGQLAFLPGEKLKAVQARYELDTVAKVGRLIRQRLDLPKALADRRLELIHRIAALSLAQRARANEPFEGPEADFFFETLLDAMAEVLTGPISSETERSLAAATSSRTRSSRTMSRRTPATKKKRKRKTSPRGKAARKTKKA